MPALRRLALLLAACVVAAPARAWPPRAPAHTVVVIMENRAAVQIVGSPQAPYINALAARGARFDRSYAVAHPSQPNYLALFTGSTQGLVDDRCPVALDGPTLAGQLIAAGRGFVGYAEDLPAAGDAVCRAGDYVRKHAPWANYAALPASASRPWRDFPRDDYAKLPAVAFVVPNLVDDMHDGSIADGDRWLRTQIDGYVRWAATHDSLLILTWDEDDSRHGNRIATVFVGPMVRPGVYDQRIDHYSVLRTIEALHGLPFLGAAAQASTIEGIWSAAPR